MSVQGDGAADVHLTEVAGITTVWVRGTGPFAGGLLLRVGTVDEELPQRGTSHMLEHLALHGIGRPGEHTHGQVDTTTMHLHTTGEPDEVAAFLTRVARQLAAPPVDRLADEKGVLVAEAARRGPWAFGELSVWRWGTRTYGADGAREWGLTSLTPERLWEWSRRFVRRGNAVLWFSGPPPAGLDLGLPDGGLVPAPPAATTVLPQLPAYYRSTADLVAGTALLPRSMAASTLAAIVQGRLVDDLRTARAAAYSPEVGYRPMDGATAGIYLLSDIVSGRAPEVVAGVVDAIGDVARRPPRPEELDAHRQRVHRAWDTQPPEGMLGHTTHNLLHGAPVLSLDELRAELDALAPDDIAAAAGAAYASTLVQIPEGVAPPQGWPPAPASVAAPVTGRKHAHRRSASLLTVGAEGVTHHMGTVSATVRFDDLAGLGLRDDGSRLVVGGDGVHLSIEPGLWRRGAALVDAIDQSAPTWARFTLPPRDPSAVPRLGPWYRDRHAYRVRRALGTVAATTGGVAAFAASIASAMDQTGPVLAAAGTAVVAFVIAARAPRER